MNTDIRKYIKNNFKGLSKGEIKKSIIESIKEKEDITLPGLGVFFEILWNESTSNEKDNIINLISNNL